MSRRLLGSTKRSSRENGDHPLSRSSSRSHEDDNDELTTIARGVEEDGVSVSKTKSSTKKKIGKSLKQGWKRLTGSSKGSSKRNQTAVTGQRKRSASSDESSFVSMATPPPVAPRQSMSASYHGTPSTSSAQQAAKRRITPVSVKARPVKPPRNPLENATVDGVSTSVTEDGTLTTSSVVAPSHSLPSESSSAALPPLPNTPLSEVDLYDTTAPIAADSVQLVVLLMDPASRRFEILLLDFQLEVDTLENVVQRLPLAATEQSFARGRFRFVGLTDRVGTPMNTLEKLSRYFGNNDNDHDNDKRNKERKGRVAMAIPEGLSPRATASMARPILTDPKVVAMLRAHGVNLANLDPFGSYAPTAKGRTLSFAPLPGAAQTPSTTVPTKSKKGILNERKKPSSQFSLCAILFVLFNSALLLGLLALCIQELHVQLQSPLIWGDVLQPGRWKSECGLMFASRKEGFLKELPFVCDVGEPRGIRMRRGGILTFYKNGEEVWSVQGDDCVLEPKGDGSEEKKKCVSPPVRIDDFGSVYIGSKKIQFPKRFPMELSPWPFAVDPRSPQRKVVEDDDDDEYDDGEDEDDDDDWISETYEMATRVAHDAWGAATSFWDSYGTTKQGAKVEEEEGDDEGEDEEDSDDEDEEDSDDEDEEDSDDEDEEAENEDITSQMWNYATKFLDSVWTTRKLESNKEEVVTQHT